MNATMTATKINADADEGGGIRSPASYIKTRLASWPLLQRLQRYFRRFRFALAKKANPELESSHSLVCLSLLFVVAPLTRG